MTVRKWTISVFDTPLFWLTLMYFSDEVFTLNDFLKDVPSMESFCRALRKQYSFNSTAFTEIELLIIIAEILLYCRDVDRARICLPSPIIGTQCRVATRVFANSLKALAMRPEEDSASLKTLVVENIADHTLCELWVNPTDVMNMQTVLYSVQTLLLTLRRQGTQNFPHSMFGIGLWNMVYHSANLRSLCLAEPNRNKPDDGVFELTTLAEMDHIRWLEDGLPGPALADIAPPRLTVLELRHISILPEELLRIAIAFGPSLEELYMNNVLLMTQQSPTENMLSDEHLWVGLPNQDPGQRLWVAMRFRALMPKLRTCRCSYLSYSLYVNGTNPICGDFDYSDPAGLGRSLSQRFVEVVTGTRQPRLPSGEAMVFYPHNTEFAELVHELKEERRHLRISEHDYHAYKLSEVDRAPDYQYSLDGVYRNCVANSVKELQYIADKVSEGVNAVHGEVTDGVDQIVNMMPDLFASETVLSSATTG